MSLCDEVTRATRVGRAHLEALEAEELAALPAPVFVKGFIRAYCEFLQAEPGEALARYRELIGDRGRSTTAGALAPRAAGIGRGPVFVSLILLMVLGAALFILNSGRSSPSRSVRPPAAGAPATATEPAATPVTAAAPAPARPEPAVRPLPRPRCLPPRCRSPSPPPRRRRVPGPRRRRRGPRSGSL